MNNRKEKKTIIYLIIISIVLIYFSLFFIHNIYERGKLRDSTSASIIFPDNAIILDDDTEKDHKKGEDVIVDNEDRFIIVRDGIGPDGKSWSELKEINMFNNFYFHDEAIIAPGVWGSYSFTVENQWDIAMEYNINFVEENPYEVNMVYKMKKNGEYIMGNENEWGYYTDLNVYKNIVNAESSDVYTIEWKWKDNYNDTQIGETPGAYYKMHIKLDATEVVE